MKTDKQIQQDVTAELGWEPSVNAASRFAPALQTLAFVLIVFGNQATTYTNRERRRLWSSRPSRWLFVPSAADIAIAAVLSIGCFAMAPLPATVVVEFLISAAVFAVLLDFIKVPVLRRLDIV